MKILFIIPNYPESITEYLLLPPLELTTIASVIENNGHEFHLIDMRINNNTMDEFETILKEKHFDIVCFEGEFYNHCNIVKMIRICKKLYPSIPIVLRGEVATLATKECLERNKWLDYVLMYQSENSIIEFIDYLKGSKKLNEVSNIAYREKSKIVINDIKHINDINDLPKAKRKIFDLKKYLQRDSETIVRSTRGCPSNCSFCIKTKCAPFRIFHIDRFLDEIEELIDYGFESFFFSDDSFSFSEKRIDEFLTAVKKRKLKFKWTSNMRIVDITDSRIKKMKEAGAYRVFIGIETISSTSSNLVNKRLNKDLIREKISILKENNIEFHASFILGCPGDTEEDVLETFNFIKEIEPTLITLNKLKVFPGTDIYNNPDHYGIIVPDKYWYEKDDWTRKNNMGTKLLPPNKIDELWKKGIKVLF